MISWFIIEFNTYGWKCVFIFGFSDEDLNLKAYKWKIFDGLCFEERPVDMINNVNYFSKDTHTHTHTYIYIYIHKYARIIK